MFKFIAIIVFYAAILNWYDDSKPKKRKIIKVIYGILGLYFMMILPYYDIENFIQSIFDFTIVEWAGSIGSLVVFAMYFGGFWGLDKYANR